MPCTIATIPGEHHEIHVALNRGADQVVEGLQ
jgi:hypothetical protein